MEGLWDKITYAIRICYIYCTVIYYCARIAPEYKLQVWCILNTVHILCSIANVNISSLVTNTGSLTVLVTSHNTIISIISICILLIVLTYLLATNTLCQCRHRLVKKETHSSDRIWSGGHLLPNKTQKPGWNHSSHVGDDLLYRTKQTFQG